MMDDEPTALYRVFGEADLLLYIGISNDFGRRWKQHARKQPWWDEKRRLTVDQWFDSREEAEAAEATAIMAEKPKYNKKHAALPARPPRRPGTRKRLVVPQSSVLSGHWIDGSDGIGWPAEWTAPPPGDGSEVLAELCAAARYGSDGLGY
jgi:predicted GIY-YIG superfamily endonuclease